MLVTVGLVAKDGMTDGGQMNSNLVGATRMDVAPDKGCVRPKALDDLPVRMGRLAVLHHRHLDPNLWMPPNRESHAAG